eukprot:3209347-Rhodomonas_salina.2
MGFSELRKSLKHVRKKQARACFFVSLDGCLLLGLDGMGLAVFHHFLSSVSLVPCFVRCAAAAVA